VVPLITFGGGIKYAVAPRFLLRIEVRDYFSRFPTKVIAPAPGAHLPLAARSRADGRHHLRLLSAARSALRRLYEFTGASGRSKRPQHAGIARVRPISLVDRERLTCIELFV